MDNTDLVTKKLDQLEKRKKRNWMARYSITLVIVFTFILLIGLLFFEVVPTDARDLLNILLGAYVAVLAKTTDYWFKEKEDPEIAEMQEFDKRNGNGNSNSNSLPPQLGGSGNIDGDAPVLHDASANEGWTIVHK